MNISINLSFPYCTVCTLAVGGRTIVLEELAFSLKDNRMHSLWCGSLL
jgi:hypothetical protein